jgi:methionine synthase II (cobalamin-independent)
MASRRRKLSKLVFPDYGEWTTKWISRSILATPKWQINAIQGSFYYNEWIDILAGKLDGVALPQRSSPSTNYERSVVVGIGVALSAQEYEKSKVKVPSTVQNQFLKDLLEGPTVAIALNQSTVAPFTKSNFMTGTGAEKKYLETRPIGETRRARAPMMVGEMKAMEEPAQVIEPIIAG